MHGYFIVLQQSSPPSSIFRFFANLQSRKSWPSLNPTFLGWGWVLDEWNLPILYSGGSIFRKYLSIFCIFYACGGDSPRKYEKSSGIIIRITRLQCHLSKSLQIANFVWPDVHVVTPMAIVHLVTPLYTNDVNCSLNPTICKILQ